MITRRVQRVFMLIRLFLWMAFSFSPVFANDHFCIDQLSGALRSLVIQKSKGRVVEFNYSEPKFLSEDRKLHLKGFVSNIRQNFWGAWIAGIQTDEGLYHLKVNHIDEGSMIASTLDQKQIQNEIGTLRFKNLKDASQFAEKKTWVKINLYMSNLLSKDFLFGQIISTRPNTDGTTFLVEIDDFAYPYHAPSSRRRTIVDIRMISSIVEFQPQ
ncbi:MAG: hypothetical protein JWQ35_680 [Bacteriovoracaceae bacterium]|nr:hypothetical protein [Bacteriovoracaceae bacterium]